MSAAIEINNVSKVYKLWKNSSSKSQYALLDLFSRTFPKPIQKVFNTKLKSRLYNEFIALSNINFKIDKGSSCGIIGKNGAGKSTLLEIVSGTVQPTSGNVVVNGRISALLELGSGVNPEFSGRENILIYGMILGLSREFVTHSFKKIEEFADIGRFIDQPLKTYSSGMKMRLAFAVVSFLEPEILIIDEALAVGDDSFRRKCYARIDYLLKSGITFVLVSHSSSSIVQLCSDAIWLHKGSMMLKGDAETVTNRYQQYTSRRNDPSIAQIRENLKSDSNNCPEQLNESLKFKSFFSEDFLPESTIYYEEDGGQISTVQLLNSDNKPVTHILNREKYTIRYKVVFTRTHNHVFFSFLLKTPIGVPLGGSISHNPGHTIQTVEIESEYIVDFNFECNLAHGTYFVNVGVKSFDRDNEYFVHRIIDVLSFRVLPIRESKITSFVDFKTVTTINKK